MKNIYKFFIALFLLSLGINNSNAQCISTSQYPGGTLSISAAPGATTNITTCNYGGEYSVDSFTNAGNYSITSNITTDFITVTDNSNNILTSGITPLSISIPSVGIYRIHISTNTLCGTASVCRSVNVIAAMVPCSGTPATSSVIASSSTVCASYNFFLSLSTSYTTALNYQWQSSSTGTAGVFSNITGATSSGLSTSLTVNTAYRAIVTCTAGPSSTTATPIQLYVAATTTNSVPYFEGFEGITQNNQLPNCSWSSSNPTIVCQTYTAATGFANQFAKTGSKFASFRYGTNTSGDYFYTNGIQLTAGVNYLANTAYITDGFSGWNEFRLLFGTSQSTTGLTSIASVSVPINTIYQNLNGTFSVSTSGIYYVAVKCIGNFSPSYLTFDDVSVQVATNCTGTPTSSAVSALQTTICPGNNTSINVTSTYTSAGISYQWLSSTTSSISGFLPVSSATLTSYTTPTLGTTTWYKEVVSCSFSGLSFTTAPLAINVIGTTTNSVPYFEGFEGITQNNQLPNCSWSASSPTTICKTYTAATGSFNQTPKTGLKFASFQYNGTIGGEFFYSNGIQLNAGTTYSANAFYITDGLNGWNEFSLLFGTSQSTVGLTNIASVFGPITNTTYSALGNAFTVPTTGIYYVAIKNIGSFPPWYFTWDDLSVTVLSACSGAPASNSVIATQTLICSSGGSNLSLSTSYTVGGLTYQWAAATASAGPYTAISGATLSTFSVPSITATTWYRNVITCTAGPVSTTATPVQIVFSLNPTIVITPSVASICIPATSSINLSASGAISYTWSPGSTLSSTTGVNVVASPTITSTYTVAGSNSVGCVSTNSFGVNVISSPIFSVNSATTCVSGGSVALTVTSASLTYCQPGYTSGSSSGDYIGGVQLSTLSNTTTGLALPYYTVYPNTGATTTTLTAGATYSLFLNPGTWSSNNTLGGWIDYNKNGDLTETPEKLGEVTVNSAYPAFGTVVFTVPTTAFNGVTRLRIREVYFNTNIDPCTSATYGETEDYIITIVGGTSQYSWTPGTFLSATTGTSVIASPTTAANYTITTSAYGCSNTATASVAVAPPITISGPSVTCTGFSITLIASGATTYTWNTTATSASIAISPTINTTYTVTGVNASCTTTAVKSITVNPAPSVSLTAATTTACTNSSTIALTGSPAGGTYAGTNVVGNKFTPGAVAGTFTPTYAYTSTLTGCSKTVSTTIVVSVCTGLDAKTFALSGLQVYPNPNTGIFTVELNNGLNKTIQVTDLTGRVVLEDNTSSDKFNVDINTLANGIYYVKIISNNASSVLKVIKQ